MSAPGKSIPIGYTAKVFTLDPVPNGMLVAGGGRPPAAVVATGGPTGEALVGPLAVALPADPLV